MTSAQEMMEPHVRLTETQEEWDGDGLNPPTNMDTWNAAQEILDILISRVDKLATPMIDAAANGDIHLLWQRKDRFVLVIVDSNDQTVKWFVRFHHATQHDHEGVLMNQDSPIFGYLEAP